MGRSTAALEKLRPSAAAAAESPARGNEVLKLLRSYLGMIRRHRASTSPELRRLIAGHARDLAAHAAGAGRPPARMVAKRRLSAGMLDRIKTDAAENVARHDTTITALAKRHGVTVRTVQRLFEAEGTTFTAFVLAERLAHAHRMLSDPRCSGINVSAIAFRAGFGDLSYFNRVFRAKFGVPPSGLRAVPSRDPAV